jgi:hypothetical protein
VSNFSVSFQFYLMSPKRQKVSNFVEANLDPRSLFFVLTSAASLLASAAATDVEEDEQKTAAPSPGGCGGRGWLVIMNWLIGLYSLAHLLTQPKHQSNMTDQRAAAHRQ